MTTTLGVRPLGVRGEPLHHAQAQIRTAIRRRLGTRYAALLTDAQPHTDGPGLDWYAEAEGVVRPLASLSEADRRGVVDEIDGMLAAIAALGRELAVAGAGDAALTGRSLQQAVRRPSDDYLFLVGDQPVIVAWGYEAESLPQPLKLTLPALPPAPVALPVPAVLTSTAAPVLIAATPSLISRFLYWLLLGLLLVALLLGLSWLLRTCAPTEPDIAVERMPPEPVAQAPAPPPDPTPEKRATLASLTDHDKLLRADLAKLELELRDKRAQCKPPEPPRTEPRVAAVTPPVPPPPRPQPPPQPPQVRAPEPAPPPPPRQAAVAPPPPPPPPAPPAVAPPGTLPCNADTASGGQGITRNKHFLGNQPGPVTINYDMKTIPDQMNVYYQGQLVASTGRMISGRGGLTFNFQPRGGDYTVMVEVVGANPGTTWRYIVRCP